MQKELILKPTSPWGTERMMESQVYACPVPTEQQPLNEYQQLKESWFFQWAVLERPEYLKKLGWLWSISWLMAGPLSAASFAPGKYLGKFLLCSAAGASVGVLLALLRLYLGWSYVRSRLLSETVFYEESGWYDGQCWTKPDEVLTRDRLMVTYQVEPILRRLVGTLAGMALFLVGGIITWFFL